MNGRCYPFRGKFTVTSLFGYRPSFSTTHGSSSSNHKGIDLAAKGDTTVVACESSRIVKVAYDKYRGNYVYAVTDSGYGTVYQHLSSVYVRVGDRVGIKGRIGLQGATGNVSGPHLHFEVSGNTTWQTHTSGLINPANWWGMQNVSTIKGKTFDGNGYLTGYPEGITSSTDGYYSSGSSSSIQGYTESLVPSGEFYEVVNETGFTTDWLYGRRYRVLVILDGGKTFDVSELRCSFEIIKTAYLEANQSTVTIYNLNADDENKLIKEGQTIIIEAGYQGNQYGRIFIGNIIQPIRSKENGTDYKLTLVSMDSDRYVTYGLIGVSLVAQQSARDAANILATKSSEAAQVGYLTNSNIIYPRGKVMFGMSKTYLEQLANTQNSMAYVSDGKVNIIAPQDVDKNQIFEFGPKTGLIGTPTQTSIGITCDILLNPRIDINSLFKIDNTKIANYRYQQGQPVRGLDSEGIYRVVKLTHRGDTRGEDWVTHIEAISQAGLLPEMASGDSLYIQ